MIVRSLLLLLCGVSLNAQTLRSSQSYAEMCDASAAIALNEKLFIAADDEGNLLRVYERNKPTPVRVVNVAPFLLAKKKGGETDLEGAARVGDHIYWISSHGRDKNDKVAPNRHQFFALRILGGGSILDPIGRPYTTLLKDLIAEPRFAKYDFATADKNASFNIEGMCARPDGSLLIGFRKPVPNNKGLLLPILNPDKIILGEKPKFGDMIELDLGGYGVRDIMFDGERFLIVGAQKQSGSDFRLFSWDEKSNPKTITNIDFGKLFPEAIFRFPNDPAGLYQVLSDDGDRKVKGDQCKDLPPAQRLFRASEFTLPR